MKKNLFIIIPILISCTAIKSNKSHCNENEKFKEMFFFHLEYVKKNITVSQDSKFRESVIFLSNYGLVSTNHIMNYSRSYPYWYF